MSIEIVRTKSFDTAAKSLAKRYRSFKDDYAIFIESLQSNPHQGAELSPGVRKVRMTIRAKGRGKSGGARVITYNALISEYEGKIYLLYIYDKSEASNVRPEAIGEMLRALGLNQ